MTGDDERLRFQAMVSFRRSDDLESRVEDWFRLCREHLSGPVFAGLGDPRHGGSNWGVDFDGELDLGSITFPPRMSLQYWSMVPGPIPPGPFESARPLGEVDVSVWMNKFPFGKFICEASTDNLSAADVAVHLRDLVADHVSRFRVGYGAVTNAVTGVGDPPLEPALRRSYVDGLYQSEQVLRGYAWVTVVPVGLAQLIEERAKAFPMLQTRRADSGVLLVEAGPRPEDYDEAMTQALWECLAPALPSGVPRRMKVGPPQGLVFRDAREVAPFHLRAEPGPGDGQ